MQQTIMSEFQWKVLSMRKHLFERKLILLEMIHEEESVFQLNLGKNKRVNLTELKRILEEAQKLHDEFKVYVRKGRDEK